MSPSPQDVHTLIFRTCKYIKLHDKRDSMDVVVKAQNREIILVFPSGSSVIV